jgi:hypothetical protein
MTSVPSPGASSPHDGARDFDFLHGTWRVRNRKLRRPLTGSEEWYEFTGRSTEQPIWGGRANIEEYDATLPDGTRLRGLALRLFDPRANRWTIHWSNGVNGTLDTPLTGTFRDGVGVFYGHDNHAGKMVPVRFHWTSAGPNDARWEQAYSEDGGTTWETNWIMQFTRAKPSHPVLELRRYRLHPGKRETLIDLFDRELVESQEDVGIQLVTQFRDLDNPDVFTWLRAFPDMPTRAGALAAFYNGPVWAAHRDAANATMIDSDDVRLLRPARNNCGFLLGQRLDRASDDARIVIATIYSLEPKVADDFCEFFDRAVMPRLVSNGAWPVAILDTDSSPNTFPRLPVREGERCFVWFAQFDDVASHARFVAALETDGPWTERIRGELEQQLLAPVETWRLAPTARSRLLL